MNATDTAPAIHTSPSLGDTLRKLLKPVASLQLTVALFALSLVLVFFGTLAQKNAGIWQVVDQYFWSWIVMIDTQLFVQFLQIFLGLSPDTSLSIPVPFPGGKLIGGVMFINLLAAHIVRFKLTWKRAGVYILHSGLLLMFAGEFIAREFTVEQQMVIPEGQSVNFTIDTRNYELAIIDPSDPAKDRVTVIPVSKLKQGGTIALPEWSFDVKALEYYGNADLLDVADPQAKDVNAPNPTQGYGLTSVAKSAPPISGVDTDKKNDNPTAYVELVRKGSGQSLAIVLAPWSWKPQKIDLDGKTYVVQMRNTHYYKPYRVHLNEFRFDRYIGTNTPKNYSSDIRLTDSEQGVEFETRIAMNEPMRYRGETFYQSSFSPDETHTILSVVKNPGALLPYISCIVVGLGMLVHFGIYLVLYLLKMLGGWRTDIPSTALERWLPWGVLAAIALLFAGWSMPHGQTGRKNLNITRIASLPVVDGGRVKPLDTVARVGLRKINHKESYTSPEDNQNHRALDWWLSTASAGEDPSSSVSFKADIFRIESDQVLNLLGLARREGLRYSANEVRRKFPELQAAVMKAQNKPDKVRDLFDVKVLDLFSKLRLHADVLGGEGSLAIAPAKGGEWRSISSARDAADVLAIREYGAKVGQPMTGRQELAGYLRSLPKEQQEKAFEEAMEMIYRKRAENPDLKAWDDLFAAYRAGNQEKLDAATTTLETLAAERVPESDRARVRFEQLLNDTELYFKCIFLYGFFAPLVIVASWITMLYNRGLANSFRRTAFLILLFAFILHTFTLIGRMWLMDRPLVFVTNLYSTAVFIGWVAVGLCLLVEWLIPISLGVTVASVIGFATSILAHNLAGSGDTLEMMQAVLDTNFWLATHVTTINAGYAATYVGGVIAICYLILGIFTPFLTRSVTVNGKPLEVGRLIGQILYGAIAGATVLSFIGTVLGGIWGDQSWGRFWGWDPKENGALMIVLWNAMILHARWCGLVKDRGIAVLALGGNMITTWSYFGTNQLGVGLHAYGFSNTLAAVCVWMWGINLCLICMSLLPKQYWRSYQVQE